MTHPHSTPFATDTNHFDPLPSGVSTTTDINVRLGQLSKFITDLEIGGASVGLVTIPITAGESLLENDAAYLNPADNKMYAIDANAAPALAGTIRGFVQETVSSSALGNLVIGGILGGFSSLTAFLPVYADSTGAGTVTQARPAPALDSGQMAVVPLGMAISATQVSVMPPFMDCRIRYQKRFSPALDETTTIEHGKNSDGYARRFLAFVTQNKTGTEYASSNQDSDVYIEGPEGAGGSVTPDSTGVAALIIGDTGGTDFRVAQSFTITAGILSQIQLPLQANSGSPTGDITWKVHSDSAGIPGTVLASGTFTPVPSSTNTINVSNGPYLAASTTYWVSFEAAFQGTNNRYQGQLNATGAYAGGVAKWDSGVASFPNTWAGGGGTNDFRVTVTTSAITHNDKLAQGIQVSELISVQSVKLWLKKVGSPTGNLTVKLQTNSGGNPSGTTVTNGTSNTVAASSLSTSYGYITFTFSTPPSLSASTQYHIVLETADSQSNTNYVVWGADGSSPGYTNGEMKRERAAVWSAESKDAVFQVVTDGVQYIQPVMVDYYTSTKADMVAQAGDTSGATIDTKSTFKCKAAGGFSDVTVEVVP